MVLKDDIYQNLPKGLGTSQVPKGTLGLFFYSGLFLALNIFQSVFQA